MKKRYYIITCILCFTICGCQNKNIDFQIAKNYFIKNNFDSTGSFTINSAERFNSIFGIARTMGKDGEATIVDFNNENVIALISDTTKQETQYKIISLTEKKDKLTIKYKKIFGTELTFTIKPFIILLVDKRYNNVIIEDESAI